jgi:hypothetical protein
MLFPSDPDAFPFSAQLTIFKAELLDLDFKLAKASTPL